MHGEKTLIQYLIHFTLILILYYYHTPARLLAAALLPVVITRVVIRRRGRHSYGNTGCGVLREGYKIGKIFG